MQSSRPSSSLNPVFDLLRAGHEHEILCLHEGRWVTRGEFVRAVAGCAAELPRGLTVINACESRLLFMVVFCAALIRGQSVLLPANRGTASLEALFSQHPDAVLVADQPVSDWPAHTVCWRPCSDASLPSVAIADPAVIAFTSGSTGQPAAHGKRWALLAASTAAALARFGLNARIPVVATVPPQHMYGLECSVLYPLIGGMAVHCGRPFYPEDVRQALQDMEAPAMLVTTPVHLRAMVRAGLHWPRLHGIISATAPLSRELALQAQYCFGVPVDEIYGATETGAVASRRLSEDALWRPYAGVQVHDDGDSRAHVSGLPWYGPVELPDDVHVHDDGRFELIARPSDLIKVGGKRGSLAELNRILLEIDGIEDGIVFMPEAERDAAFVRPAAVVVAPDMTVTQVLIAFADMVDPVFVPRPLIKVRELPRTAAGKVARETLVGILRDNRARRAVKRSQ